MTASGETREDAAIEALDSGSGPALPRGESEQLAMAQAIVRRAASQRLAGDPAAAANVGRRAHGRGVAIAAAALLGLTLVGSAWAAVIAYRHAARQQQRSEPKVAAPRTLEAPMPPRPASVDAPAPEVTAPTAPAGEAAPKSGAVAPSRSRDLLDEANRLRAARRWRAAERVYGRVARDYPGSDESYAALIASATLRLEQLGRPEDALAAYKRALAMRPHGDLVEQARYGVAQALRALGRTAAEVQALRSFVAAHPDSLRVRDARARLHEIE